MTTNAREIANKITEQAMKKAIKIYTNAEENFDMENIIFREVIITIKNRREYIKNTLATLIKESIEELDLTNNNIETNRFIEQISNEIIFDHKLFDEDTRH